MADKILEKIDDNRRGFVKRLLGVSFAAPFIATFSLAALSPSTANALESPNQFCPPDLKAAFFFGGAAGAGRCQGSGSDGTATD